MKSVILDKSCSIDFISSRIISLNFGNLSLRMSDDDLFLLALMFDLSEGEDMPDEEICYVVRNEDDRYELNYRGITIKMCIHSLAKFAKICKMGAEKIRSKKLSKSERDIEKILQNITEKIQQNKSE